MKQKTLWKVSVVTLPEADEAVAELLLKELGEPASTYTDLETGEATVTTYLTVRPAWPRTEKALATGLARIQSCGLKLGAGRISLEKVRRENWAESWKRHFQPLEISPALLVKPSWSKQRAKKNQSVVILDPGLSFGTGQHPTTGFCLRQLAEHRRRGERQSFLDIGTGSGILAIAAAKLGCSPVEAFDFDPEAVLVARTNARRNRVTHKIHLHQADATKLPKRGGKKYSLVCANLISNLLISEQARILATLKPGGVLVLAGILQTEFAQVQNAYVRAGVKLVASCVENEWQSGAFAWDED